MLGPYHGLAGVAEPPSVRGLAASALDIVERVGRVDRLDGGGAALEHEPPPGMVELLRVRAALRAARVSPVEAMRGA